MTHNRHIAEVPCDTWAGNIYAMFAATNGCAVLGTEAVPVRVEASVEPGLPRFTIVGMREAEAREAKERIRCALSSVGVDLPLSRVTINLAPADVPKAGASFDLPIVMAMLACTGKVSVDRVADIGSHGEVSLDAKVRPASGTMASSLTAARLSWRDFIVGRPSAALAAHASVPVHGVSTLTELIEHVSGKCPLPDTSPAAVVAGRTEGSDMSDVRGQAVAVEAAEIAAAGGHHVLFFGPPGTGKTMIASRLPGVLPELDGDDALEVATIHDAAGLQRRVDFARPFRAPHPSISAQALVGGGSGHPVIGELTLAHRGVLFLDELPEFRPSAVDALRQPLEDQAVTIRRARWVVRYPAHTQLVAAMNLCKCGRSGSSRGAPCSCSPSSQDAYQRRVSGAILQRFDIRVVMDVPGGALHTLAPAPSSVCTRVRVVAAREVQHERWGSGRLNGHMRSRPIRAFDLGPAAQGRLERFSDARALSGRSQAAAVRVARTIADLDGRAQIGPDDLDQAFAIAAMPRRGDGDE